MEAGSGRRSGCGGLWRGQVERLEAVWESLLFRLLAAPGLSREKLWANLAVVYKYEAYRMD